MITYYDHVSGRSRVKSRYKYAALALCLGFVAGALTSRLL
jgi:hypothetical protein